MLKVNKMQKKVNKLLSVFTNIIKTLEKSIVKLNSEITHNDSTITALQADNVTYAIKIAEYENLKNNISGVLGGVKEE